MGKVSRGRANSKKARASGPMGQKPAAGGVVAQGRGQSRGQRKRQAKRDALRKRKELMSRVPASREAGAMGELGSLAEALESTASSRVQALPPATSSSKVTEKRRQRIAAHETTQLSAVLAHPAFQSDPFAAIQEHLNNTVVRSQPGGKS